MSLTSTLLAVLQTILLLTLAIDAGAIDAGVPDGGIRDAGVADAGIDAGITKPVVRTWKWIDGDGGFILDGGFTDQLTLTVGETARVIFPFPIVLMQCDQELLGLGATEDTLLLTGADAGHTACGFWFWERAWPHRSMDVTVFPREAIPK
jgi:hypothetical protein